MTLFTRTDMKALPVGPFRIDLKLNGMRDVYMQRDQNVLQVQKWFALNLPKTSLIMAVMALLF